MVPLRVKIGDTIEFGPVADDGSETPATMTVGRIMDVHPSDPELCAVQISPYESLRAINLRHHVCKVLYAVGDIAVLTPEMVGWKIEIANDAQQIESAVVKRVDLDINCALVAFESGKKEWLDLALASFKVLAQSSELKSDQEETGGHQEEGRHNASRSPALHSLVVNPQQEHGTEELTLAGDLNTQHVNEPDHDAQIEQHVIPLLSVPARTVGISSGSSGDLEPVQYPSKPPPESDATSFDWYSEGGHVEICDHLGNFIEGAILCSKTDSHVQLYNETHQFFEISMAMQSFKVVIHGLLGLKWIPMGQAVEVYSAMAGGFHQGVVIKAAEVSKLTPIRFANGGAVEWLDLSTQTFKLVFLSEPDQVFGATDADLHSEVPSSQTHKPHGHHHHHDHHHYHQAGATALALPSLKVGQRIEIFEAMPKQFAKFKVASMSESIPHEYVFEPHSHTSSSSSSESVIRSLANLRCRIPLHPQMWEEYREILPGHRVDVFDKADKTVANAKIVEVGSTENQHSILVRYKDGKKSWIRPQSVKARLRLQGEPLTVQSTQGSRHTSAAEEASSNVIINDEESAPIGTNSTNMWERAAPPAASSNESDQHHHYQQQLAPLNNPRLSRNRSDLASLSSQADDIAAQSQLTHYALTNGILTADRSIEIDSVAMTQQIPSVVQPLDFSSLRKLRPAAGTKEAVYSVTPELSTNASSHSSRSSARSRKSDSSISGRLPFTLVDVWREEVDLMLNQTEYVHNASGTRQSQVPEWLERSDSSTGKLFVMHTPTNTLYSVPINSSSDSSTSRSNSCSAPGSSSSPGDSGRRVVVPIGPLEACGLARTFSTPSLPSTPNQKQIMTAGRMLLRGKRALVVGLMNKHSLAASVTQALLSHGAHVVVSSKSALTQSQVKACAFHGPTATSPSSDAGKSESSALPLHFCECDVESEESISNLMESCGEIFDGQLDVLVHSIAFAPRETFTAHGGALTATKVAWHQAMDISAYSLIALTRAAYPLLSSGVDGSLTRDRSILALSYAGASKVMPNYSIMGPAKAALEATSRQLAYELGPEGIRVNCLSPGPMNTVSARGIPGISRMRKYSEEHSPLRRNATGSDVGNTAAFLASDLASAITAQTIYVDAGLSAMAPYSHESNVN